MNGAAAIISVWPTANTPQPSTYPAQYGSFSLHSNGKVGLVSFLQFLSLTATSAHNSIGKLTYPILLYSFIYSFHKTNKQDIETFNFTVCNEFEFSKTTNQIPRLLDFSRSTKFPDLSRFLRRPRTLATMLKLAVH